MNLRSYSTILVLLLTLAAGPSSSHAQLEREAEANVNNYARKKIVSGVHYAESKTAVASGHFGQSQPERAINEQTLFNIGSISKSFLAYLIVKQAREGLIDLHDPVSRSLPFFRHKKVTWHHLLTHTSGLPDFQELGHDVPIDLNIFPVLNQAKVKSEPGKAFRYNSLGYFILEKYLEFSHKKPIRETLKEEIFAPLKMDQTFDLRDLDLDSNIAFGTFVANGKPNFITPNVNYQGNVQVYSSLPDLRTWFRDGLVKDRLGLGKTRLNQIFSANDFNYGYGWVVREVDGEKTISHGGQSPGFSAYIRYNVAHDVFTIAMSNREHVNLPEANQNMENLLLNRSLITVKVPKLFTEPEPGKAFKTYDVAGTFVSSDDDRIVITKDGSDFLLSHGELSNKLLIRRNETSYVVRVQDGGFLSMFPVVIQLDESDQVTSILWDATKEFVKRPRTNS
jgi:CubicO group peptidase (beta-lactamase class C family)